VILYALAGMAVMTLVWLTEAHFLERLGNLVPRVMGATLAWVKMAGCVAGLLLLPLGLSAHLILWWGPRKGRLGYGSLWLMAALVSLLAAASFFTSQLFPLGERWRMFGLILFVGVLPIAWCFTWSIDVVRRRKRAQEEAS
jgi:hypothetical protein